MKELTLPSRIESVDEAAMFADEFARANGCGDDIMSAVDLAVRESVANAVKHGNKFDESKLVEMTLSCSEGGLKITVRDFGTGFSVRDVPDPTDPENLLKVNGRGILFMRSFMDEVTWSNPEDGGMKVTMIKKT
jgi:serine/threonine-protein kinase RsbW